MKKALSILSFLFLLSCSTDSATDSDSPSSNNNSNNNSGSGPCKYNGHTLYKGAEGGCYYYNSSGNKQYVERSYCNC